MHPEGKLLFAFVCWGLQLLSWKTSRRGVHSLLDHKLDIPVQRGIQPMILQHSLPDRIVIHDGGGVVAHQNRTSRQLERQNISWTHALYVALFFPISSNRVARLRIAFSQSNFKVWTGFGR